MQVAETDGFDKRVQELIAYDNASIAEQDERGRMKLVEDRAEDRAKKEVVKRCLEENMEVEFIARITNLSLQEISKIIEEVKNKRQSGE